MLVPEYRLSESCFCVLVSCVAPVLGSGWEANSYGYHGDDGNVFRCSGSGTPYGPKFTTGDVIGCCINFVDKNCFFTKNGNSLGMHTKHFPHF